MYYVKYTDDVRVGDSKLFRIRINPKYKDDEGVLEHEITHVMQWYASLVYVSMLTIVLAIMGYYNAMLFAGVLGLAGHNLLSTFSRWYRKHIEAEAFAAQLDVIGWQYLDSLAESLAYKYDLNITPEQAKDLIVEKAR